MKRLEQLCPHQRAPRETRWSKRYRNRQIRRLARRNPEAAPERVGFRGFTH